MSPIELKFCFGLLAILLATLSFIGGLGVKALIRMSRDLNEIKTLVSVQATKHDNLEKRVETIEDKL